MSAKKSPSSSLILGTLAILIAGAVYLSVSRQDSPSKDSHSAVVARELETQPSRDNDASLADEPGAAVASAPASAAVAPVAAPAPVFVRQQPDFDHYFKRVAARGRLILPENTFDAFKGSSVGDRLTIDFDAVQFEGTVVGVREHPNASKYALNLDDGNGRIIFSRDGNGVQAAQVAFNQDSRAFWISEYRELQSPTGLLVEQVTVSDLYCAPPGVVYPLSSPANAGKFGSTKSSTSTLAPLVGVAAQPKLNSIPGAEYVIYCDFDGELVEDFDLFLDGEDEVTILAAAHPKANNTTWVTSVWKRVSEDFAPFDITVTTDRAVYDAADDDKRLLVVITPDDTAAPGAGGVAASIGYFRTNNPVCWVFNPDEYGCAATISHEAGHVLGLSHDGRTGDDEYYGGHNTDYAPGWAPIMGAPWSDDGSTYLIDEVYQWSRGEYLNANNQEDDLAIIASASNGFGYKDDDFANSYNSSTLPLGTITTLADNNISGAGLISRTTDVDVFSFVTASGGLDITIAPLDVDSQEGETDSDKKGANLAVNARLLDSAGNLIATGSESGDVGLSSNLQVSVPFGKYYIEIDGGGRGSGPSTGFSDYGSLGQYTISGTIAAPPLAVYGGAKQLQSVLTGDTEVSAINGTDFGFTQASAAAITHTFNLTNTSNFAIENLSLSLANATVFTVTSVVPDTIAVGATFPLTIKYDAVSNGLDRDVVTISYDGEQSEVFTFTIGGTCTPREFEDNYDNGTNLTGATDLTGYEDVLLSDYKGLGWMTDALDHYKFTVDPEDQFISVETFYDATMGSIEFELYRIQGNQSILVAIGYGDAGSETIQYRIPDGTTSLNYFILVKPAEEGASLKITYDLKWSARSLGTTDGDLYEDNDTSTEAFDITRAQSSLLSNILGTATLNDEDWYRLDVARDPFARFIYVSADFDGSIGDLQVELYDENLQLLGRSSEQDDRALISYFEIMDIAEVADEWDPLANGAIQGVPPGTYYVRVTGDYSDDQVYDMFFGVLEDDAYEQVGVDDEGEAIENDQYANPYDLGTSIIGTSLSEVNGYGMTASYAVNASVESFKHYNDGDFYKFAVSQSGVTEVQVAFTGLGVNNDNLTYRLTKTDGTFIATLSTDSENPADETHVLTIKNPDQSEYLIYVEAADDIGYLTAYDFKVTLVKGTTLIEGAVEDNYEENDKYSQRFDISGNAGSWLSSIDGYGALFDFDWYKIRVPSGATKLEVTARSDSTLGNLDLYVRTANGGIVLQESTDGGDTETITYENPLSGDLSVVILGDYVGNRYNLFWDVTFAEDNYEENDTRATSFDLTGHERRLLSKLDGYGIQKDDDYYKIEARADTAELRVLTSFTHEDGDIDVDIYNETGAIVARATSSDDNEEIVLSNPAVGNYYVHLKYGNQGNKYDLSWAALTADEVAQINLGDDAYENNDTLGESYQLTAADSRLSNLLGLANQTDDDWYSITVGDENFGLYVECLFADVEGDIDLEIYDDFGTPIIRRDSITDDEIVDLQAPIPGGVYYIRVYGPNLGNSYDLYFIARTEDAYEENDTRATAYDITALTSPLSAFEVPTQSDDDWYKINVTGEHPFLEVTLDYIELNGAIDFRLVDANGAEIIAANSTGDSETVFVEVEPGVNYIHVYGDNEYNTYDVSWAFSEDDEYEDNDVSADATDITDTPVINAAQYDTDWYKFDVTEENAFITVIATYIYADGNIDVALYSSDDRDDPLKVSATTGNSAGVRIESGPGTYYVEVTGDNINGDYQLLWTTAPDDEYEDNDMLEEATDLTALEGTVIEAVQYDEDWYEVLVQPGNVSLTAELVYGQADGNLSLTLYDSTGIELALVDTTEDDETLAYGVYPFGDDPETYYIKVSGVSLGTAYSLSWFASTEDGFEGETGNNTYEDASDVLLGSEGQRISGTIGYGGALDEDWYEVRINAGDDGIVIEALFDHTDATNIDIELYNDSSDTFLKRSIGVTDVERIHYLGEAGTYYLRVFGKNGGNPYDLVWNSYKEDDLEIGVESVTTPKDPPDNDAPDTPRSLVYPDLNESTRGLNNLEFIKLDNLTQLDEDWYLVQVAPGDDIFIIDLEFEHALGDIDVAVYNRETGERVRNSVEPDQGVSETDNEKIELPNLGVGALGFTEYLVCVHGYGIVNPKANSFVNPNAEDDWAADPFDPFTDDLKDWAGYDSIQDDGTNPYYDLPKDNEHTRGLGNTYSLRWISTVEDEYDIETVNATDIEVNDSFATAAEPDLFDQYDVPDDDNIIDSDIRTIIQTNLEGVDQLIEYQSVFDYRLTQKDEDWFKFTVAADDTGRHYFFAAILFNQLRGDLDLFVYDETQTLVASSARSSVGSSLEWVDLDGDGDKTYYLQIVGNDLGTPYSLNVRGFFDDVYEENDVLAEAVLNANITNKVGIPLTGLVLRDIDLYQINIKRDQVHLEVSIPSFIEVELDVLDADGNVLPAGFEQSGGSSDFTNYSAGVISPDIGTYYIRVAGSENGFTYGLEWAYDNKDEYEGPVPFFFDAVSGLPDTNNDTPDTATNLTRLRLEPPYDPDDAGPLNPIKELAYDYSLLSSLTLGEPGYDPFGHAIQEGYDWYSIQIPSWFLASAKALDDKGITVLKRDYYVRLFAEIEFVHEDGDINMEIYEDLDPDDPGNPLILLGRAESTNDIESLYVPVDPLDEDRIYLIRVYGDDAANDYSLKWDALKEDAYEDLEDESALNDTNNFVDLAHDLTTVDGVSTEGQWLNEIRYKQDVNADGVINSSDGGLTSPRGYGLQANSDDWYTVVVSPGSTQISVDLEFYSDNDTGYKYTPDDVDMDFEVYFLAGNDGDAATADLRKPVLIGRSIEVTDDTPFSSTGEDAEALTADITTVIQESATFNIAESGIYFIRIYYDNGSHPYRFKWSDLDGLGDPVSNPVADAAIIEDYVNGRWSMVIPSELPANSIENPDQNPDGDAYLNWAEYVLGLDSEIADYQIIEHSIIEIGGVEYYQLAFLRNVNAIGLGYEFTVQESEDLNFGAGRAVYYGKQLIDGTDLERVIYRSSKPIDEQSRNFFRLVVNQPASDK